MGRDGNKTSLMERALANANLLSTMVINHEALNIGYDLQEHTILGIPLKVYDTAGSITSTWVAREINDGEYYLKDMQRLGKIKPGDTVLDLGTNVGITAIMVAKMFPGVRVIGVEATPFNYAAAIKNIALNNVSDQVTVLCGALAATSHKPLHMLFSIDNPGSSTSSHEFFKKGSSSTKGVREIDVQTITVDEIIHFYGIDRVPFIKLDCEGCEYEIVPALSLKALSIFREALVFGETHCDRMTIAKDTVRFVHDVYTGYEQSGPHNCDGGAKKWTPQ